MSKSMVELMKFVITDTKTALKFLQQKINRGSAIIGVLECLREFDEGDGIIKEVSIMRIKISFKAIFSRVSPFHIARIRSSDYQTSEFSVHCWCSSKTQFFFLFSFFLSLVSLLENVLFIFLLVFFLPEM